MTKNMTLRLPDYFHKVLRVEAAEKGVPLHEYILACLHGRPPLAEIIDPPLDAHHEGNEMTCVAKGHLAQHGGTKGTYFQVPKSSCTCGPGEKAKGKHNKHCPAK